MSSHAVLSFLVWPVSVSPKHASEELARTDCIRWMFLVRESNLAHIQPTYGGHYVSNQTERILVERNGTYASPAHSTFPDCNC
jgi:hypothetical protein